MAPSNEEVYEKVRDALVEALAVDEEEVTPEATLMGDLGAESIDFLDIIFQLETAFDIEIPRDELSPEFVLNNPEYVQDGVVTAQGVAQLKSKMPFVDFTEFEKDPKVQGFTSLITVNALCKYVSGKLA